MATKKKAGAPVTSEGSPEKKSVDKVIVKPPQGRLPGGKKAGLPTRAEKKPENKARHMANVEVGRAVARKIVADGRAAGLAAVGKPYIAPQEPYWRKPTVEWSAKLGEDLFVLMSTGHGMKAISEIEGMPSHFQMIRWLADKTHPFSECRMRALENLVPYYEELAKDITLATNAHDIVTKRQTLDRDGEVVDLEETRTVDNVERSKLAFIGLQWTLSHLAPKKHGRNADQGPSGPNEQLEALFSALKAGPAE